MFLSLALRPVHCLAFRKSTFWTCRLGSWGCPAPFPSQHPPPHGWAAPGVPGAESLQRSSTCTLLCSSGAEHVPRAVECSQKSLSSTSSLHPVTINCCVGQRQHSVHCGGSASPEQPLSPSPCKEPLPPHQLPLSADALHQGCS